jgi:hypothetical protein
MLMAGVFSCALFLVFSERSVPLRILPCIPAAVAVVFIILAQCRSGLLAVALSAFVLVLFRLPRKGRIVLFFAMIAACVAAAVCLLFFANKLPALPGSLYHLTNLRGGLDAVSSGRISAWKDYLDAVTWTGIDPATYPIYNPGGEQMVAAHNAPLDFAFRSGAPAGVAWLLLEILSAVYILRRIFGRAPIARSDLFVGMSIISFFVISMIEVTRTMFDFPWAFCYFMSLGPLLFRIRGCHPTTILHPNRSSSVTSD